MAAHESGAAREIADAWARTLRGIRDPRLQIGQVRAHLARLGVARAADVLTIVLARAEQREEPFAVLLLRVSLALAEPDLSALKRAIGHVAEARGQLALASFLGAELVDAPERDVEARVSARERSDGETRVSARGRNGTDELRATVRELVTDDLRGSTRDAADECEVEARASARERSEMDGPRARTREPSGTDRPRGPTRDAADEASSAAAPDAARAPEPTRSGPTLATADEAARTLDPALARMLATRGGRPLSLGERKSLARRRDKSVLARVLRDPHPDVVRILLDNPALTELDVVRLCARRPVQPDTLGEVFRHPRWICRYRVRLTLALNPYTPEELTLQLLPHLLPADRNAVARAGDVPERVRAACVAPRHRRLH